MLAIWWGSNDCCNCQLYFYKFTDLCRLVLSIPIRTKTKVAPVSTFGMISLSDIHLLYAVSLILPSPFRDSTYYHKRIRLLYWRSVKLSLTSFLSSLFKPFSSQAGVFEVLLLRLSCLFDPDTKSLTLLNGAVYRRDAILPAGHIGHGRFLVDSLFDFVDRLNCFCLNDADMAMFCAVVLISPGKQTCWMSRSTFAS